MFVDGSLDSNPPIDEPANGSTFGESGASLKLISITITVNYNILI